MVLWPVSLVYIVCNKIAQNRHDEPFFKMNTPRCEVTTSTNLGQIRASSPPTRELTCTLVCGQKSKHSEDEDLDFLQETQVLKTEPTIRRNHRVDMLFLRLGYWFRGLVTAVCLVPWIQRRNFSQHHASIIFGIMVRFLGWRWKA